MLKTILGAYAGFVIGLVMGVLGGMCWRQWSGFVSAENRSLFFCLAQVVGSGTGTLVGAIAGAADAVVSTIVRKQSTG